MTSATDLVAALPGVLAASEGSNNMLLPHSYDLVWGTVAFAVIALALMRYALPRFTVVLDERTRRIEEGLDLASKAKSDQKDAELRAQRLIDDARRESAQVRDQAQNEAKAIIAQARTEAQSEGGKALEAARRQIQAEKQAAQISLRTDVGLLASDLAEKIVGEHLEDHELSSRVIDRFLSELEDAPASQGAEMRAAAPGEHR